MTCHHCNQPLTPRDTELDSDLNLSCGECYLATAGPDEVNIVLAAIAMDTARYGVRCAR